MATTAQSLLTFGVIIYTACLTQTAGSQNQYAIMETKTVITTPRLEAAQLAAYRGKAVIKLGRLYLGIFA